jgi:hypothetical protein
MKTCKPLRMCFNPLVYWSTLTQANQVLYVAVRRFPKVFCLGRSPLTLCRLLGSPKALCDILAGTANPMGRAGYTSALKETPVSHKQNFAGLHAQ